MCTILRVLICSAKNVYTSHYQSFSCVYMFPSHYFWAHLQQGIIVHTHTRTADTRLFFSPAHQEPGYEVNYCTGMLGYEWNTPLKYSLVLRPLPDFILQPWRKIGRRPGIKTPEMVDSVSTKRVRVTYWPSPPFPVRDVVLIPGLLPIFLHSCEIKSGRGLGTRLP